MDSLKDLLAEKDLDEPSELTALREYFQTTFKMSPMIKIGPNAVTVTVSNSKLASEIRGRTFEIQRRCQLTKPLKVYVSHSGNEC